MRRVLPWLLCWPLLVAGASRDFDGTNDQMAFTAVNPNTDGYVSAMWIKTTGTSDTLWSEDCLETSTADQACLQVDSGGNLDHSFRTDGTTGVCTNSGNTTAVNDGAWHHVAAARRDDGTDECFIVVDGSEVERDARGGASTGAATDSASYGQDDVGGGDYAGSMAHAIYSEIGGSTSSAAQINEVSLNPQAFLMFPGTGGRTSWAMGGVGGEINLGPSAGAITATLTGTTEDETDGPPVMLVYGGGG